MSQKSNLQTIRDNKNSFLIIHNTKLWASFFILLNSVKRLFSIKGVFPFCASLYLDTKALFLNFSLFYQVFKISYFKRKSILKSITLNNKSKGVESLLSLFKNYTNKLGLNVFVFSIDVLNIKVDGRAVSILFNRLRFFRSSLFSRRFNFFIDFLKIVSVFLSKCISISSLLKVLSKIFKLLSKRLHAKYLLFVKTLFIQMVNVSNSLNLNYKPSGIKFVIAGRLKGKARSSSQIILIGNVPSQSFNKKVEFSREHVHTLYGTFGIKVWFF